MAYIVKNGELKLAEKVSFTTPEDRKKAFKQTDKQKEIIKRLMKKYT